MSPGSVTERVAFFTGSYRAGERVSRGRRRGGRGRGHRDRRGDARRGNRHGRARRDRRRQDRAAAAPRAGRIASRDVARSRDPVRRRGGCLPARGADGVLDAGPQAQPRADRRRPAARQRRAHARRGGRPARRQAHPDARRALAAAAFGADLCRFSGNGSTHPNQALCLAVASEGEPVLVSRCSHKSVAAGLVLSGARPVWVAPAVDEGRGVALGHPVEAIEAALEAEPDARAILLVEPSWLGVVSHVARIAELAHARGIPLICDQAWAGHFGFHPGVPASALALGADAVAISTHKVLTSFTPGRRAARARHGLPRPRPPRRRVRRARDDEPVGQPLRLDRSHARAAAGARPRSCSPTRSRSPRWRAS